VAKNEIGDDFSGCFREIDEQLFSYAFLYGLMWINTLLLLFMAELVLYHLI
jgi:hypothetical protein